MDHLAAKFGTSLTTATLFRFVILLQAVAEWRTRGLVVRSIFFKIAFIYQLNVKKRSVWLCLKLQTWFIMSISFIGVIRKTRGGHVWACLHLSSLDVLHAFSLCASRVVDSGSCSINIILAKFCWAFEFSLVTCQTVCFHWLVLLHI